MMSSSDEAVAALAATARTARCHNAFFRQQQLKFLHDALRTETTSIISALRQDRAVTDEEASTEVAVALNIVKENHASINPKTELQAEYRIAKGQDAVDRTVPWGVVYIDPNTEHTPLLSVVSPLSTAIAAGNCVLLNLSYSLRALPSLLRTLLSQALEADTFQIVSSDPSPESLIQCLSVLQNTPISHPTHSQLVSSRGRVIAVVDRTADLASAAEYLVTARFAFGGTSPYAPNLILINEFAKRDFLEQVLRHAIRFLASTSSTLDRKPGQSKGASSPTGPNSLLDMRTIGANKHWQHSIITQGDKGAVIELIGASPGHAPLPPKYEAPIFFVSSISSLDHAIDLITNGANDRLLAAYHFAAPPHAKYLSQFISADVSFANHIPSSLLLGPAAPSHVRIDLEKRYIKDHFVKVAPVSITPAQSRVPLIDRSSRAASKSLEEAAQEIKTPRRAEWIALGFFEQGILIGLTVYGVPLLTCVGATVFFGVRAGLSKWASS